MNQSWTISIQNAYSHKYTVIFLHGMADVCCAVQPCGVQDVSTDSQAHQWRVVTTYPSLCCRQNKTYLIEISLIILTVRYWFSNRKQVKITQVYSIMMERFQTLLVNIFIFMLSLRMHAGRVLLMKTCAFGLKSWWNISGCKSRHESKERFFVLVQLVHPTPSVPQSASCRLSSKPHQTEVIHIFIMNKQKCMCLQTLHYVSLPFTQKNNEPAYRAGSFTDLIQSQVPALKSLVMQMTTSCSFPLWCASSSSIIAKIFSIYFFYFNPVKINFSSINILHDDFCLIISIISYWLISVIVFYVRDVNRLHFVLFLASIGSYSDS